MIKQVKAYWGEASMRARAVPEGRPVRCGELKKGTGSAPAAGTRKGRSENLPFLYPEPGSNRHGLPHWCLRPARLPIPPSGLGTKTAAKVQQIDETYR